MSKLASLPASTRPGKAVRTTLSPHALLRRQPRHQRQRAESRLQSAVAQATERQRLSFSQDLHDELGGALSVLAQHADSKTASVAQAALRNMRCLLSKYREDDEAIALRAAQFRSELADLCDLRGVLLQGQMAAADTSKLSASQWYETTQILREATTNALKHSGCTEISIRLEVERGQLTGEVIDNGNGQVVTTPPAQPQTHGLGRTSMEVRVKKLGGTLRVTSAPAKGTSVTLSFSLI